MGFACWKVFFRATLFRKIMHDKSDFNVSSICAQLGSKWPHPNIIWMYFKKYYFRHFTVKFKPLVNCKDLLFRATSHVVLRLSKSESTWIRLPHDILANEGWRTTIIGQFILSKLDFPHFDSKHWHPSQTSQTATCHIQTPLNKPDPTKLFTT